MSHSSTAQLLNYWAGRRRGPAIPRRRDIDPAELGALLPRMLLLAPVAGERFAFALAGEAACDLLGRRLKGVCIDEVFVPEARSELRALLRVALAGAEALVIGAEVVGVEGAAIEIVLAPLAGSDGTADRLIGHCQPLRVFTTSRPGPRLLALRAVGRAGEEPRPPLRLAVLNGRRVA
ncbi:MAG TPA: PAS domain-containing protein [Caulobacteraceae bacterium]|nr:PAS domain-containing protein [Caulobacteraceae bacterium]